MAHMRTPSYQLCKQRRDHLVQAIEDRYPDHGSEGIVLLLGNFEHDAAPFKQDPSFYYFTGVQEPGSMMIIDRASGKSTLFVPNFGAERAKWVAHSLQPHAQAAQVLQVDEVAYAGALCKGYHVTQFFRKQDYEHIIALLQECVTNKKPIFTANPTSHPFYIEQRSVLLYLQTMIPDLLTACIDIAPEIARLRQKKDKEEVELLYRAIDITIQAHEMAAQLIKPDVYEQQVQAGIEYTFVANGATAAFPSIVAGGVNATILHYHQCNAQFKNGLAVVDIGAQYNYYCADITRTYPVSGVFTKRQRELYMIVLEAQTYIADLAKPGMWINNPDCPEQSLNHRARAFFKEKGYEQYFLHGIGHYLGLNVHDVGDYTQPLQVGDIITIEPGLYIPQEEIGIRIEDNYWIIPDGALCLSENLPKSPDDIEVMMQEEQQEHLHDEDEGTVQH